MTIVTLDTSFPMIGIVLLAILGVVIVALTLMFTVPALRPKFGKKKSTEEIASEEVKEITINPNKEKSNPYYENLNNEKARKYITSKEKDLGFVFTDDDIDSLIPQVRQDWEDEGK
ncbi:MAG: hypothetical protein WCR56_02465 [Bacilli bacterium]|jgi:hypothetical protein